MQEGNFSRTAYRVAIRRAAHQLLDQPKVLDDPLALRIIGSEAAKSFAPTRKSIIPFPARSVRSWQRAAAMPRTNSPAPSRMA